MFNIKTNKVPIITMKWYVCNGFLFLYTVRTVHIIWPGLLLVFFYFHNIWSTAQNDQWKFHKDWSTYFQRSGFSPVRVDAQQERFQSCSFSCPVIRLVNWTWFMCHVNFAAGFFIFHCWVKFKWICLCKNVFVDWRPERTPQTDRKWHVICFCREHPGQMIDRKGQNTRWLCFTVIVPCRHSLHFTPIHHTCCIHACFYVFVDVYCHEFCAWMYLCGSIV